MCIYLYDGVIRANAGDIFFYHEEHEGHEAMEGVTKHTSSFIPSI